MSRSDIHLDAMLRHLGAAYYDSLYGRADDADVSKVVAQVATHMGEPAADASATPKRPERAPHRDGHRSRVRHIMTTSVVSVDRAASGKEIASLLARHHIGGVPVLQLGRHVAGMVTEADLVATAADRRPRGLLPRRGTHPGHLTAAQLMTSPAVTTHPDAPLARVARTMTDHRIGRLPVVDANGVLVGIVSRRDLLKVFLRPDAEIASQIQDLLADLLLTNPDTVTAAVRDGVVTLTGQLATTGKDELQHLAALVRDIDGVEDVIDRTGSGPV
jgi:CBS domain-containing protein